MNQKQIIRITDNCPKKEISQAQAEALMNLSGIPLGEIKDTYQKSLLIFPENLSDCKDKIQDKPIYNIIGGKYLQTENVMGFVGIGNTQLKIGSRFDKDSQIQESKDYFFQYMLSRVLQINLVNLDFSYEEENVFDLLVYFFPIFLQSAMEQGLYREYQTFEHNDGRLRGVLDISRHIRNNIPFTGKISYKTREHSTDNNITELIRHTIEYIYAKPSLRPILSCDEQTKKCVSQIVMATPSYSKSKRTAIIAKNLRPTIHPYYSEYTTLQKLCVMILRGEQIRYGNDDNEVYGLLIDGAWLWEAYLNTLLSKQGFTHPENLRGSNPINLFKHTKIPRYPDFYSKDIVLDAKYKKLESKRNLGQFDRNDLNQVIVYMDLLALDRGGYIFPATSEESKVFSDEISTRGGTMYGIGLEIPQGCSSFDEFFSRISKNEATFIKRIHNITTIS